MSPDGLGPLPLLAETWPLRDLLILDYNANLGFFERAGLAKARSRGARVTLVSDADMVHADHEAIRFAGRSYLDARALCHGGGSFHPKLVVALGAEEAAVLIGSGNTSPGGWISNAELWTLLRATPEGAPSTLGQVADFLEDLGPLTRFTSGAGDVIGEVAHGLRTFPATEEGPRLVSSAFGPIIDQLPAMGAVSELVLSAPFFDRKAEAVSRLIERFDPQQLELVVGDYANYDGAQLGPLVAQRDGSVATIAGRRYHHAKLIEWSTGAQRMAVTGSPNLSRSALLESMAEGGNCELGLVTEVASSLRPDTAEVLDHAEITKHQWERPAPGSDKVSVQLLDVVLEGKGLLLDLRAALDEPAKLQHHDGKTWVTFADVPAGIASPVVPVVLDGGQSVRLFFADETASASRSVTDLERTNFRHVAAKRTITGRPENFSLDPRFVTVVEQALSAVRAWSAETHGPRVSNPVPHTSHTPAQGWREYIDGFRAEVGDDFGFFLLPSIMGGVGIEPPEPLAEEQDRVEVGGDETVDEEDLIAAEVTARLNGTSGREHQIARYRSMTQRLVKDAPNRPDAVKISAAVLTAGGVALGCWKKGPELNELLRKSVEPLLVGTLQEEFLADAASITAVILALMRSQIRVASEGSVAGLTYRRTAEEAAPLLTYVELKDVEYRCAGFVAEGLVKLTDVDFVMSLVNAAVAADPIASAVKELEESWFTVEANDRLIEFGEVRDALTAVLKAMAVAETASPVGARASDDKVEAIAIWTAPHLFVARRVGGNLMVTRYLLPLLLPSGYFHSRFEDPSPRGTQRWPGPLPEADVRAAFEAVGLTFTLEREARA